MNCMKRAFVSLIRKPAKSFILLLLIFILCNVIAGAISVKNALVATKRALLEKMGAEVRVEIDYDWIINAGEDFDYSMLGKVDKNMVDKMSQSPYLKRAYYTATMYCQGFEVYDPQSDEEYPWEMYFNVEGCNQATLKDVENNKIVIASGRTYNAEEIANGAAVAVIAQSVAERNNLSLGDTVTLHQGLWLWDETTGTSKTVEIKKEFTIIGLFTAIPKAGSDEGSGSTGNAIGIIGGSDETNRGFYTTNGAVDALVEDYKKAIVEAGQNVEDYGDIASYNASFIIDSIDNVELFESENKVNLPRGYKFSDNSENLAEVAKPMDNMNLIADIILYVAVGATVLVIGLLVTLFLKDRTREMGIYLSLGERKVRIALQILTEVLAVAVIGVTLSVFSGNVLAKQLSANLLSSQLDGTTTQGVYYYGDDSMVSGDEVLEEYSVELDGKTIGFIYLVGLGSVLVSTMVPVVATLRLKPREILL